jgi:hypothetical protein
MPGTGGARKVRFAQPGEGKRGGYRIITFFTGADIPVFLLSVFTKNEKSDLSKDEKNDSKGYCSYYHSAKAAVARRHGIQNTLAFAVGRLIPRPSCACFLEDLQKESTKMNAVRPRTKLRATTTAGQSILQGAREALSLCAGRTSRLRRASSGDDQCQSHPRKSTHVAA